MNSELKKRITTAGFLIFFFLAVLLLANMSCMGHWLIIFIIALINLLCAIEFTKICSKVSHSLTKPAIYMILSLLPSVYAISLTWNRSICNLDLPELQNISGSIVHFSILIVFLALTYVLVSGKDSLDKANQIAGELLSGTLLIAVGISALYSISLHPASHFLILWLILLVTLNDTAAYFVGSNFKSENIVPAISPKKSLYGFIAGIICGTATGLIFGFLLAFAGFSFDFIKLLIMSFSCVVAAQFGDLLKSYIKRLYGAKDSGAILPGHGGVLDRVDGILAAAIVLSFFIFSIR